MTTIFKDEVTRKCQELDIEVMNIECNHDYTHITIQGVPTLSVQEMQRNIKNATALKLKTEFPQLQAMPSVWKKTLNKEKLYIVFYKDLE